MASTPVYTCQYIYSQEMERVEILFSFHIKCLGPERSVYLQIPPLLDPSILIAIATQY